MEAQITGKKIKQLRISHKMTQAQLAEKLSVTDKAVSKWETGGGLPELASLSALAALFGVTVDDIISNKELPPGKSGRAKMNAGWFIIKYKKLVMIGILSVLGIFLIILNILWTNYVSETFDPFLTNETLQAIPQYERRTESYKGSMIYSFRDYGGSGYHYGIHIPARFRFGGIVSTGTHPNPNDDSDCSLRLTIFIKPRGNWTYVLNITDLNEIYTDEYGEGLIARGSAVDKYGRPLGRHPEDSEEFYRIWMSLYDRFYGNIMEMFQHMKDMFGEDAFR